MWFRKDLAEEITELLLLLGKEEITIDQDWSWEPKRVKTLRNLEEIDLKIMKDIQLLHSYNRDNPLLSEKIMSLTMQLKNVLEDLIKLSRISSDISPEKKTLARKMLKELELLLKEEVKEQRLIPGMTFEQAKKLGIRVRSFYSVQSDRGVKLLLQKEGDWPLSPTKAHLGPGVYTWDSQEAAERYRENIIKNLQANGEVVRPLRIVQITFSESSLQRFRPFDVDLLDNFRANATDDWMNRHSSLWTTNARKNGHLYVIRGVSKDLGKEHYFRPECLQEAALELVA